jgi:uncharacterized membrane protein HdeD (DUF308 family)
MSDLTDRGMGPGSLPSGFPGGLSREDAMTRLLARNWWAVMVRGAAAILFGLVVLLFPPGITIPTLLLVFGIYMVVDGIFAIASSIRAATHHDRWGLLVLEGISDLVIGAAAILIPGLVAVFFVVLLGAWGLVSGVLMTASAFSLHASHGRWLLVLSGLVSVVWGLLLFIFPVVGAVVLTWWLGAYALIFGIMLVVLAFRLRSRHQHPLPV